LRQQYADLERNHRVARQNWERAASLDKAALQTEREKGAALTRVLMAAWKDRDTARSLQMRAQEALRLSQNRYLDLDRQHSIAKQAGEQAARAGEADRKALERERERVAALDRALFSARQEVENLKRLNAQQSVRIQSLTEAAKPAAGKTGTVRRKNKPKAVNASTRRTQRTVQLLPPSLLPTLPPLRN
jgi:hypothetical protein